MLPQSEIIGLTLAELVFVLLFGLMVAVFPVEFESAEQEASVQQEIEAVRKENEELTRRVSAIQSRLRSKAMPSCVEIGVATGWLFTTTIRGGVTYEIDGRRLGLEKVLANNADALRTARTAECRHRIKIYYGLGVSGIEYDEALRKIEDHFYTKKMGPRQ